MADRRGLTLIEVLVVVAVLGLLVAILLPAVGAAREASRRSNCLNHLRQIGLGMSQYAGREGVFPTAMLPGGGVNRIYFVYSAFARTISDLDEPALMNSINFSLPQSVAVSPGNRTAAATVVGVFLCPSDGARPLPGDGPINYRINMGSVTGNSGSESPGAIGPFEALVCLGPGAIGDGLSNTALVSEKLRGGGDPASWDRDRDYWFAGLPSGPVTADGMARICGSPDAGTAPHSSRAGTPWMLDGYGRTSYNHVLTPMAATPDCTDHRPDSGVDASPGRGAFAARGGHGRGVHLVSADGAAHWIASSVALPVWRAIGTRAGGEVVELPY